MPKTLQDEFEAEYCEHAHRLPALVKNCRLSNGSYGVPCIAKAWHWFRRSREMLVVELPTVGPSPEPLEDAIDDSFLDAHHAKIRMRNGCFMAIKAAGITIAGESN
ncbi:hypothetical protein [Pseudomonas sp. 1 R 17]|uniref:hypothetical protein n=1 Tax=Pseudomonas sp. 1 R 17 TaxID=1844091 RepID=UPI0008128FC0|nr:hypothetical protein [Pseudomonas sp. 1 R 17]SAM35800.1 hypothetical protein BN1864_LIB5394:05847 [Pseudomonas sp. 1 R 17]